VAPVPPTNDESSAARPAALAAHFVRLGFEHILPGGIDHVLFVAGLVLGSAGRYGAALISLTLFTLAHTLTLGLANFQMVQVPPRFVEPLIALSIFLLAVDNLRPRPALIGRRDAARYAIVFCCGLIHGLGFANALSELAFDRAHVVLALFSFNLGVELGQVAVVALLGLALHLIRERRPLERYATLVGSAVIAACGLFLVFERLALVGAASPALSETENYRHEI
jgi:branched-subunit amino acid permease